jgi:hypothetical protein
MSSTILRSAFLPRVASFVPRRALSTTRVLRNSTTAAAAPVVTKKPIGAFRGGCVNLNLSFPSLHYPPFPVPSPVIAGRELPVREKELMLTENSIFGYLLGSTLTGIGSYIYIYEEYKVASELLSEDIDVCLSPLPASPFGSLLVESDLRTKWKCTY